MSTKWKVGDKLVTVVNGYTNDVRVCVVSPDTTREDLEAGFLWADYTEPGGEPSRVYALIDMCEPYDGDLPVGCPYEPSAE